MEQRAKDGVALDELIRIAAHYCRQAEQASPRRGPGRPPEIADWILATMVMVGVLLRKKSKSSQYAWWRSRSGIFTHWFGTSRFPARSTFFDRYHRCHRVYQQALLLQGRDAIRKGWADAQCVAIDKSLVSGRGRPWSPSARRRNEPTRRVDRDTTWGYSKHHGWVQGYAFEVVTTASKTQGNWPLIASAETASCSEQKTCLKKFPHLPRQTRFVLADAGYDSNAVGEAVEWNAAGGRTGRRFLCPEVPRPNTGKPQQPGSRQSRQRQWHRQRRQERREYFQSKRGHQLYARRKTTVEPFNSHLKQLFDLEHRTWHWGFTNNQTRSLPPSSPTKPC